MTDLSNLETRDIAQLSMADASEGMKVVVIQNGEARLINEGDLPASTKANEAKQAADHSTEAATSIVAEFNRRNHEVIDLGYVGQKSGAGESLAAQPAVSGDKTIRWVIYRYGGSSLYDAANSLALIYQDHYAGADVTVQTIFLGNARYKRTVTFTPEKDVKDVAAAAGAWSQQGSDVGVNRGQTYVTIKFADMLADKNAGLRELTIKQATPTTAGVMTAAHVTMLSDTEASLRQRMAELSVLKAAEMHGMLNVACRHGALYDIRLKAGMGAQSGLNYLYFECKKLNGSDDSVYVVPTSNGTYDGDVSLWAGTGMVNSINYREMGEQNLIFDFADEFGQDAEVYTCQAGDWLKGLCVGIRYDMFWRTGDDAANYDEYTEGMAAAVWSQQEKCSYLVFLYTNSGDTANNSITVVPTWCGCPVLLRETDMPDSDTYVIREMLSSSGDKLPQDVVSLLGETGEIHYMPVDDELIGLKTDVIVH